MLRPETKSGNLVDKNSNLDKPIISAWAFALASILYEFEAG
jgi:hypothetical protein